MLGSVQLKAGWQKRAVRRSKDLMEGGSEDYLHAGHRLMEACLGKGMGKREKKRKNMQ